MAFKIQNPLSEEDQVRNAHLSEMSNFVVNEMIRLELDPDDLYTLFNKIEQEVNFRTITVWKIP